jgi:hypothetical protein
MFYKRGLASLVITTGVWLSPSPLWATPITFSFGGIKDNIENTFPLTANGVILIIKNPQCVGGSGAIKFRTSTDGLNLEPPVVGTRNGDCNTGSLSASQFDLSFDKPVQFSSYQSKAWNAGTYELVVNGTTVSSGNTVGTSTSVTSSYAFASTPTLAANTTATLKMVPLTPPSRGGDGGKLKSITVDYKSPQTISFGALGNKTYGDAAFSLAATVSSNLAVSYTATGSCTVSGQTVTLTGAGQCTVTASQAGNDQFSVATAVVQSFTIAKATQTLSFTPTKEATLGQSRPLTATVAPSGLSVTFTSTTTNVCTVSGTTVQFKAAGACQIKASQPGNDKYEAAPSVTATIMVYPETQTQTLPNQVVGDTVNLQANSSSGLPVTYSLAPTSQGCTLQETTVKTVSVGTCVVVLTQAGNATYLPARTEYRFNIVKGTQVITFTPSASANVGDRLGLTALGGKSGNPVTFTSQPAAVCTVNDATVSFLTAGACEITATQAGNETYEAAKVSATVMVAGTPQEQNLSMSLVADHDLVGEVATVTVSPGESGNTVDLQVSTPEICSLQGTGVTLLKEGICTVTGTQKGNAQYLEASASSSVTVKTDKATFGLKVLSNKDNSGQLTQVSQADTVNIELQVTAAVKDVGKTAELFLTMKLGNDLYILSDKGWQPRDGATWIPVTQQELTAEAITVPAFTGEFPISGVLEFSAAYRLAGSSVLSQGPQPVGNLIVIAFNPVEQAKTDCLGKGGIYYAQQCFTDVKDLGNGFAGGIYVEGQSSLQTNANLACRLGKKVAVLGRFNVSDDDVGQSAEVVFAFQNNLDNATGKTIGALPKIYSAALFEGELPTTGTLPVSFGYRLLNSEGSKGVLKSVTGLTFAAPVDSCDNPDLQLDTSPLGTGKGEVLTKTAEDGSVRLVAIPATDGSAFAGWTGDAAGCNSKEAIVTIKPTADKFTCQPTFNKQVLGTLSCVDGFDTEQNIACCDLKDPKCPEIPEPCNPPKDPNTRWLVNIPPSNALDVVNIQITNLSQENREVKATLYDMDGKVIFADKTLVKSDSLPPFATVRLQMADLTSDGESWETRGKLKIPNSEGLLIQLFLRAKSSKDGLSESPLMDLTFASAKHRVTNIPPPPSKGTYGADIMNIRITNIGDTKMKVKMRLFSEAGELLWVGDLMTEALPSMATGRVASEDLTKITGQTWEGRAFAEIFPEDVKQRCNGKMLIQSLMRQNGVPLAPVSNITPQD